MCDDKTTNTDHTHKKKKKIHDSWGKCLKTGFLLLVLKDVALGGTGTGSSDNVGHIPVWGVVRSLFLCGGKRA